MRSGEIKSGFRVEETAAAQNSALRAPGEAGGNAAAMVGPGRFTEHGKQSAPSAPKEQAKPRFGTPAAKAKTTSPAASPLEQEIQRCEDKARMLSDKLGSLEVAFDLVNETRAGFARTLARYEALHVQLEAERLHDKKEGLLAGQRKALEFSKMLFEHRKDLLIAKKARLLREINWQPGDPGNTQRQEMIAWIEAGLASDVEPDTQRQSHK